MQFSDLAKSWTDTLTTVSVGSLTFFIPIVTKIDPDESLSVALGDIPKFFTFSEDLSTAPSIVLSVMLLSVLIAIGFFVIQFGEFLAMVPDYRSGRQRVKERIEYASKHDAYMVMFANAYSGYRLLCGFGGLFAVFGTSLLVGGLSSLNIQSIFLGLLLLSFGLLISMRFARYSFAVVDWILFGDLRE